MITTSQTYHSLLRGTGMCVYVCEEHLKSTLSKYPVFNTALLITVIMLHIRSLDLLM